MSYELKNSKILYYNRVDKTSFLKKYRNLLEEFNSYKGEGIDLDNSINISNNIIDLKNNVNEANSNNNIPQFNETNFNENKNRVNKCIIKKIYMLKMKSS